MVLSFRRLAPWLEPGFLTIEHMTIQRMEHVGIVVDDLAAATEFFVELGLELQGEGPSMQRAANSRQPFARMCTDCRRL